MSCGCAAINDLRPALFLGPQRQSHQMLTCRRPIREAASSGKAAGTGTADVDVLLLLFLMLSLPALRILQ
eukprot:314597-Pelagomonas_calceolata.AAC.1